MEREIEEENRRGFLTAFCQGMGRGKHIQGHMLLEVRCGEARSVGKPWTGDSTL